MNLPYIHASRLRHHKTPRNPAICRKTDKIQRHLVKKIIPNPTMNSHYKKRESSAQPCNLIRLQQLPPLIVLEFLARKQCRTYPPDAHSSASANGLCCLPQRDVDGTGCCGDWARRWGHDSHQPVSSRTCWYPGERGILSGESHLDRFSPVATHLVHL